MADMITRCPKCATAFRISDSLLKSAKGVVRCGSCLSVFNAKEHLEAKTEKKASPPSDSNLASAAKPQRRQSDFAAAAQSVAPPSTAAITPRPERMEVISSPKKPSDLTRSPPGFPSYFSDTNETSRLFENTIAPNDGNDEEDDSHDEDESWALELLKDDSDSPIQFKKITTAASSTQSKPASTDGGLEDLDQLIDIKLRTEEIGAPCLEQDLPSMEPLPSIHADAERTDETTEHFIETAEPFSEQASQLSAPTAAQSEPRAEDFAGSTSTAEEHLAAAPTGDDNTKSTPNSTKIATPFAPDVSPPTSDPGLPTASRHEPYTAKSSREKALDKYTGAKTTSTAGAEIAAIKEVIASIEPEPLEVAWQEDVKAWKKRLLWPLLALLALIILVIQIAWLEFNRLNRVEPYRSAYAIGCSLLGCELPALLDRSQIQTSNLLVRSHPKVENALMVDVILQNNAPFEQTFPALLLTFTDLQNRPVATRKLTPDEYLGGELSGRDVMPSKQPIHIGLEIVDPGKDAVSYSISIVD